MQGKTSLRRRTESLLFPWPFYRSELPCNSLLQVQFLLDRAIVRIVAPFLVTTAACSSRLWPKFRGKLRQDGWQVRSRVCDGRSTKLTLSNRSYSSPTVCFSFPFTQLAQIPGPSMALLPQMGVPSCNQRDARSERRGREIPARRGKCSSHRAIPLSGSLTVFSRTLSRV